MSGGAVFASEANEVVVLGADGTETRVERATKDVVADAVWDAVVPRLPTDGGWGISAGRSPGWVPWGRPPGRRVPPAEWRTGDDQQRR